MRVTKRAAVLALGVVLLFAAGTPAAWAWNPFEAAGRQTGKFVDRATAPTIANVETSAHRLVADVDARLSAQLDRAGSITTKVVADVDTKLAARLAQVDGSLEARILQVSTSADALVQGALGRLDQSARVALASAEKTGLHLIKSLGKEARQTLADADAILERREKQLGALLTSAVDQADLALGRRIEQLDQAVELRLGNVDVIISKQGLRLEETLLRVAALVGGLAFLLFVAYRLWKEIGALLPTLTTMGGQSALQIWTVIKRLGGPLLFRFGVAALAVSIIYATSDWLGTGARQRMADLVTTHRTALDQSWRRFDFAHVRYHASQLELLQPARASRFRGQAAKAELMRDVLARPTSLQTPGGIARLMESIRTTQTQLGGTDPDILVLKAFLLWQVTHSRRDQREAAQLCGQALRMEPGGFLLAPLARHYVRLFLFAPVEDPSGRDTAGIAAELRALAALVPPGREEPGWSALAPAMAYDRLAMALDRASGSAYLDMLRAQAELAVTKQAAARNRRNAAAARVIEAWRAFDEALGRDAELAAERSVLAVFTLNDAIWTRAQWFIEHPDALTPAPALALPGTPTPGKPGAIETLGARLRRAPPRLGWARRYMALLGDQTRDLVNAQEAQRFTDDEARVLAFEAAVLPLWQALGAGKQARAAEMVPAVARAALAAARLGLFIDDGAETRRSVASDLTKLLPETAALPRADIATELDASRLRLL